MSASGLGAYLAVSEVLAGRNRCVSREAERLAMFIRLDAARKIRGTFASLERGYERGWTSARDGADFSPRDAGPCGYESDGVWIQLFTTEVS
jgi:hypothetical protein